MLSTDEFVLGELVLVRGKNRELDYLGWITGEAKVATQYDPKRYITMPVIQIFDGTYRVVSYSHIESTKDKVIQVTT